MFAVNRSCIDLRRHKITLSQDFSHDDNRETQLLYAEPVKIIERGNFCKVYAPLQDYIGYVLEEELIEIDRPLFPDCVVTEGPLYGALLRNAGKNKVYLLDGSIQTMSCRPIRSDLYDLITEAKKFLSIPYLWGGCSTKGIDCSGLIHLLYRAQGIFIPRDACNQALTGITIKKIKPGDALFFYKKNAPAHHVVMSLNQDFCIEAPQTGDNVRLLKWGETINFQDNQLHITGREPTFSFVKRFLSRPRNLSRAFV